MGFSSKTSRMAVVGAAGKMGKGISLLLAGFMVDSKIESNLDSDYLLTLIDTSDDSFPGLLQYLKAGLRRIAEKKIIALRQVYASRSDLVENREIIDEYVGEALSMVRVSSILDSAKNTEIVFEATPEEVTLKQDILTKLDCICGEDTYYFSNTSSIPISVMEKASGIKGRIMGVHFYNPPVVQKLVEIIETINTRSVVHDTAYGLVNSMGKMVVYSNDVAGFIGSSHLVRDGLYTLNRAEFLEEQFGYHGAVYIMNRVSEDFLIRPMGTFQLIDYVGVDIFQNILKIVSTYIEEENLHSDLIDRYVTDGIIAGQYPDGSQKDGFLKYEKNRVVGIYSSREKSYVLFNDSDWREELDMTLGNLPTGHYPWKTLIKDSERHNKLKHYFKNLKYAHSTGSKLALEYLQNSREIALHLKESGVTSDVDNVNAVLVNGFNHLYGPVNTYY